MIYHNLRNLVLDILEEECDITVALIKLQVDSNWLKQVSFSNNDESLLKYEVMIKNLMDS